MLTALGKTLVVGASFRRDKDCDDAEAPRKYFPNMRVGIPDKISGGIFRA